jgi:hypothetical protein
VSLFFASAYLRLGLPAVLTGLIAQLAGPVDASAYTSGVAAAIVAVALIVVLRAFGAALAPSPPSSPSDSWCSPAAAPGQRSAASLRATSVPAGDRPAGAHAPVPAEPYPSVNERKAAKHE